jgi:hypothetical protein
MYLYLLNPDKTSMTSVLAIESNGVAGVLPYSIHGVGDYTVISPYNDNFPGRAGVIEQVKRSSSIGPRKLLKPETTVRAGVSTFDNMLQENGDFLLQENGDKILGES